MIKRIELTNFMSHERTVIEPAAGLTVLVGPNNCGKSAVVSALQILCHNAKSNYVMRHGEKKCEIIVETDDGHVVQWSRTKSGSPKYLIDGQEHDRLKQGVPAELHEILHLSKVNCDKDQFDVHFGEQKSPVFLLNDSGKAAAQFFASSSDAIRLVEMQDRHKSKVRDAKREQTRLSDQKNRIGAELESLEPVDSIDKRLTDCEKQFSDVRTADEAIEQSEILIRALSDGQFQLEKRQAMVGCLRELARPPGLADTKSVERLILNLNRSNQNCQHSSAMSQKLSALERPPEIKKTSSLEKLIRRIDAAERTCKTRQKKSRALEKLIPAPTLADQLPLGSLIKKCAKLENEIAGSKKELKANCQQVELLNTEIENWVAANPVCPTCGGETKVEQLVDSRGGHRHG